jgi:hypothetical protein
MNIQLAAAIESIRNEYKRVLTEYFESNPQYVLSVRLATDSYINKVIELLQDAFKEEISPKCCEGYIVSVESDAITDVEFTLFTIFTFALPLGTPSDRTGDTVYGISFIQLRELDGLIRSRASKSRCCGCDRECSRD